MVDVENLYSAVSAAVAMVVAEAALAYFLSKRRSSGRVDQAGDVVLEYGRSIRYFASGLSMFAAGFFVFLLFLESLPRPGAYVVFALVVLVLFVLPAALIEEVLGVNHRVGLQGIEKRSPWAHRLFIPWDEVESIRYSSLYRGYVVKSPKGSIGISDYLDGFDAFERLAREKVPSPKWKGQRPVAQRA